MTINIPQTWTPPTESHWNGSVVHRQKPNKTADVKLPVQVLPKLKLPTHTLSPLSPVSIDNCIHFRDVGFVGDCTQLIQFLAVQKEILVPKARQWGRKGEKQDKFKKQKCNSMKSRATGLQGLQESKLLSPGCSSQHSHPAPCTRPASCSLGKPPPKFTKCHFQHWLALRWWFFADLFAILWFVKIFSR